MTVSGWIKRYLGELVTVQGGFAFRSAHFVDNGVPIVRMSDLDDGQLDLEGAAQIAERKLKRLSNFALNDGDFLVGMSGSIGNYAIAHKKDLPAYLNQRVGRFRLVNDKVADYGFITQVARSDAYKLHVELLAAGAAQVNISPTQIESFYFDAPPTPEQTKIAEILSTVDRAIEQTEALIAKQQRIKTGLMQDLLTRGIDSDGNLRSEETHEFKGSPLGRIPVEWRVKKIEHLLANVDPPMRSSPFGSALLKEELAESGAPLLGIDNVFPEEFVPIYRRFVTPKKARQLKRFRVRPRDIMITIMGTVGRCCMVPDDIGEALSSKHVWTISLDPELYSPYVACFQINHSPWVLNHFAKDEQGGIMASIKSSTLRSTQLPVPPPDELRQIENRLRAISSDVIAQQELLKKLRPLKTALMQDLLTGRKRVTPLLTEPQEADA